MADIKPLTKSQTISILSEKSGMTKKDTAEFLEMFISLAIKETKRAGKFTMPGLGSLKKVKRKARMGRNPATGESIKIAAKTVVKFTVAKACKDYISPPKKK